MQVPLNNRAIRKLLLSFPAKAIKILYDNYYRGLLRISFNYTHDEDASKDIVQETFSYLWQHAKDVSEYHERSIEHYLVRIVMNKSITWYNQKNLLRKRQLNLARVFESMAEPAEWSMIQVEAAREILETIAKFPKRERECLTMKIQEELSNDEISSRLGVGIKAVERSVTSARKRLKKYLRMNLRKNRL